MENDENDKISDVKEKIKKIIRYKKDVGISEAELLRVHVSDCYVISHLRDESMEFETQEEIDQVVDDIKVELSEEAIRYKPKKTVKPLRKCGCDSNEF